MVKPRLIKLIFVLADDKTSFSMHVWWFLLFSINSWQLTTDEVQWYEQVKINIPL